MTSFPFQKMLILNRFTTYSLNSFIKCSRFNRITRLHTMPKPLQLEASCHCGAIQFRVKSKTPYPYMWCFCSICRKTNGSGGYGINIAAEKETLEFVQGKDKLKIYQANVGTKAKPKKSGNQRHFCPECGSHLYAYNEAWPQWIYPYPSCIDTPLPKPENYVYICEDSKVPWVQVPEGGDHFKHYPDKGIEEWHKEHGCFYDEEEKTEPEHKKQKTSKK